MVFPGEQGSTGHKGKYWLKKRQASNHVCSAGALGSDCVLCPRKSVPGSAKCRLFKLKDSEQWLNKGGSLIVWMSVWVTQEQVEAAKGREIVRRSGNTEQLVSVERGPARLGWHPLHERHSTVCPCSAISQGRWLGFVKAVWQTLLWYERKHLYKAVSVEIQGTKMLKKENATLYYMYELLWWKSLCFPLCSLKDPSLKQTSTHLWE